MDLTPHTPSRTISIQLNKRSQRSIYHRLSFALVVLLSAVCLYVSYVPAESAQTVAKRKDSVKIYLNRRKLTPRKDPAKSPPFQTETSKGSQPTEVEDLGNVITFSTIDPMGSKCGLVYGGPSLGTEGFLIQDCGESQWTSKWNSNNGYIRRMSCLNESTGWFVIGHGLVKVERVKDELEATVVRNDPNDGIESVFFVNELYGWTCGKDGSIHKTEDGGINWKQQVTPTDADFTEIRFINPLEGWARGVGYRDGRVGAVILTTNDGGATWVALQPDAASDLSAVFFLSPRHACGIDDNSSIVCTNDGENWRVRYADSGRRKIKRALFFANQNEGWVAGEGIWHTNDGGDTWEQQLSLPKAETLENVTFANDNLGWANTLQAVWRTIDGGKTWTKISGAWLARLNAGNSATVAQNTSSSSLIQKTFRSGIITVSLCDLITSPEKFDNKMVRVKATEYISPHNTLLYDSHCDYEGIESVLDCDDEEECAQLQRLREEKTKFVDGAAVREAVFTGRFLGIAKVYQHDWGPRLMIKKIE